ncbi:ABC transporter ATP-binding protein [Halovulum sp. GXIMD14794]
MGLFHKIIRIFPYVWVERRSLLIILMVSVAASALTVLAPWPLKLLVDVALADARPGSVLERLGIGDISSRSIVLLCGIATVLIMVSVTLAGNALQWLWAAAGHRMLYALAGDMFSQVQRLSLVDHAKRNTGDLLSRITGDSWCVYSLSAKLLVTPGQQILTLVGVAAAATAISPSLTALMFLTAPAVVWSIFHFGRPIRSRAHGTRGADAAITSFAQQTIVSIPLVQVFGLADRNARTLAELGNSVVGAGQRMVMAVDGYALINAVALSSGSALILFFGAIQVSNGDLTIGSLLVLMAYLNSLTIAVRSLLGNYGQVRAIEASLDRAIEVIDMEPRVREKRGAPALVLRNRHGAKVEFDKVSFAYDADRPALRDIDLTIGVGETLALAGPTGAGKSTLAGLIPRFFDPQAGEVRIDGQPAAEVSLSSLRAQVSIVLQEPFLLPLSIAENIAFGRPDASFEDVVAAAKSANADEFIRRLPDGYETVLGERGAQLSGGQRQRISLARAITRDAPILILDEPTSAIDPETEEMILGALSRLREGRTTLVIAHRLSTIETADRVGFLEGGRLVELGTHAELLSRKGRFAQFAGYQLRDPVSRPPR